MADSYDVIVVGLGAVGSATAWQLAARGRRVLGLEQFSAAHTRGSSYGESRIIREIYFEHPNYVPLVRRAYELWGVLQRESGTPLLTMTGGLMIGRREGRLVSGVLRSADAHDIPHEVLYPSEVAERFPGFELRGDDVAVVDSRAGVLNADECVRAQLELAARSGAELHFDEPVMRWNSDGDRVRVETRNGTYAARHLVLSAGPWMRELVPPLATTLTVERQVLAWFEPSRSPERYDPARFPIYLWEYDGGHMGYGFPRLAQGVKAAVFHDGDVVLDPDTIDRAVKPHEIERVRDALRHILPAIASGTLRDTRVCPFTNTPDTHFLIDFHPSFPNVLISSPCSGHGFKFASAIGELQADLVMDGQSRFDISLFQFDRFIHHG
jgi:sarcosine oxidase